jgi:uncharacterized protein YgiM (DUF1202 family)
MPQKLYYWLVILISTAILVFTGSLPAGRHEIRGWGVVDFQPFHAQEITPTQDIAPIPTVVPTAVPNCHVAPMVNLNVRQEPSTSARILGTAPSGTSYLAKEVRFIDTSPSQEWVRISWQTGDGWIAVYIPTTTYTKYLDDSCLLLRFPDK